MVSKISIDVIAGHFTVCTYDFSAFDNLYFYFLAVHMQTNFYFIYSKKRPIIQKGSWSLSFLISNHHLYCIIAKHLFITFFKTISFSLSDRSSNLFHTLGNNNHSLSLFHALCCLSSLTY